jgi:hypothetical protein
MMNGTGSAAKRQPPLIRFHENSSIPAFQNSSIPSFQHNFLSQHSINSAPMLAFLVKRIFQALLVMLVISLIGFSIKHKVGDPVRDIWAFPCPWPSARPCGTGWA